MRFRRRGEFARQERDIFLIVFDDLCGFGLESSDLAGLGGKWRRILFRGADRVQESKIDFVIADSLCLAGQPLLFGGAGHGGHVLGGL